MVLSLWGWVLFFNIRVMRKVILEHSETDAVCINKVNKHNVYAYYDRGYGVCLVTKEHYDDKFFTVGVLDDITCANRLWYKDRLESVLEELISRGHTVYEFESTKDFGQWLMRLGT